MWRRLRDAVGELALRLLPVLYVASILGIAVPWAIVVAHRMLPPGQTYAGEQQ